MSKRSPGLLVDDMLLSCQRILTYTDTITYEQFIADPMKMDAVIRNFEVIGEAANRLPEPFKDRYTNIDWHRIRGFRNRIVHDYIGIDYSIVWEIKEHFLPTLIESLFAIAGEDLSENTGDISGLY